MDALDEHMKSIRLTQKRIQSDLDSALVWKNVITKRYMSEAERRDKLLKAERRDKLQLLPRDRERMYQLLQQERFKNQLKDQEYERSKEDIIKECSFYKTRLADLQKENEELQEKTRQLEYEKEKITLELTKAQEECESIREFVELKSARKSQSTITISSQQQENKHKNQLELIKRSSSSPQPPLLETNNVMKQSVIQSARTKSTQSSISNALPNLIQSYEEQINDLSTKLEFLQKKYDKDIEKAYDDLRSKYAKVQADFIEKEYLF